MSIIEKLVCYFAYHLQQTSKNKTHQHNTKHSFWNLQIYLSVCVITVEWTIHNYKYSQFYNQIRILAAITWLQAAIVTIYMSFKSITKVTKHDCNIWFFIAIMFCQFCYYNTVIAKVTKHDINIWFFYRNHVLSVLLL